MTVSEFVPGGPADAADLNCLSYETAGPPTTTPVAAKIGDIFGVGFGSYGYGGNSPKVAKTNLTTVLIGNLIENEHWLDLRNAFEDVALHQGVTLPDLPLPSVSNIEAGNFISANSIDFFDHLNSTPNNLILEANRFNIGSGNFIVESLGSSTRAFPWSSQVLHEFTITFSSFDAARFFFNTGGQIRISASRTGGSATAQNSNWTTLLNTAGTINLSGTGTTQTGSGGSFPRAPLDSYYNLTTAFGLPIFTQAGTGAYAANTWNVSARRDNGPGTNGANGSIIRIRSQFIDAHVGVGGGPDSIDGTLTSTISERRSIGVFVRPIPTFNTITPLTFGS